MPPSESIARPRIYNLLLLAQPVGRTDVNSATVDLSFKIKPLEY